MSHDRATTPSSSSATASQPQQEPRRLPFFSDERRNNLALCFYKLGQESYRSDPSRTSGLIPFVAWYVNDIDMRTEQTVHYLTMLFQDDTINLFDKCRSAMVKLAETGYPPLVTHFLCLAPLEWEDRIRDNCLEIRLPGKDEWTHITKLDLM